jgi:ribose/xylose/arabinose/galactoside ABC-type transport system permease subunit
MSANTDPEGGPDRPRWTDHILMGVLLTVQAVFLLTVYGLLDPYWLRQILRYTVSLPMTALLVIIVKTLARIDVSFGLRYTRWLTLFLLTGVTTTFIAALSLVRPIFDGRPIPVLPLIFALSPFLLIGLCLPYMITAIYLNWPLGPRRKKPRGPDVT